MTSDDMFIEVLLAEAHETAEKIINESKKKVQTTLNEQREKGRKRAKEIVISVEKKAINDAKIIKLRDLASTEGKAKNLILEKKQALIDNVLIQVMDKLRAFTKTDKYMNFLENLIIEGGVIIAAPDLEIIMNERDSTLPLDLNKLAKEISDKTGIPVKITKSERKIDTIGGAIIQMPDDDKPIDFYNNNPSLKLITETNDISKFREVLKTYSQKGTLPDIDDEFNLKVLEDLLKNYRKIDSLEDKTGRIVMNRTFESILNYSKNEIRFGIAQILFN